MHCSVFNVQWGQARHYVYYWSLQVSLHKDEFTKSLLFSSFQLRVVLCFTVLFFWASLRYKYIIVVQPLLNFRLVCLAFWRTPSKRTRPTVQSLNQLQASKINWWSQVITSPQQSDTQGGNCITLPLQSVDVFSLRSFLHLWDFFLVQTRGSLPLHYLISLVLSF